MDWVSFFGGMGVLLIIEKLVNKIMDYRRDKLIAMVVAGMEVDDAPEDEDEQPGRDDPA